MGQWAGRTRLQCHCTRHVADSPHPLVIRLSTCAVSPRQIHTHPSQTCFLSSVDLHTHFSYQLMLNEAIAIVLAPKHQPNSGVFHCTLAGMKTLTVRGCTQRSTHPPRMQLRSAASHLLVTGLTLFAWPRRSFSFCSIAHAPVFISTMSHSHSTHSHRTIDGNRIRSIKRNSWTSDHESQRSRRVNSNSALIRMHTANSCIRMRMYTS
jgi:hypothetical protein